MSGTCSTFPEAWRRFQLLESARQVQDTLEWEWARGRGVYLAFLVPVVDPAAQQHVTRVLDGIRGIPGIVPYPPYYWHITVKGVGFHVEQARNPDEISGEDIERLAAAAEMALSDQQAFRVQIQLPNAFESVVFLEVLDDQQRLASLNARLLDAVPGLPRYEYDTPNFLPHISIARFGSSEGLGQLKERLSALRGGAPGPTMDIPEVQLVSARLALAPPTFDIIATYPLAG